jgi:hypothetical protein
MTVFRRAIQSRDGHTIAHAREFRIDLGFSGKDRRHDAGRRGLHEPSAFHDKSQCILERKNARDAGRRNFAKTVP